jgi:hypothetical protein
MSFLRLRGDRRMLMPGRRPGYATFCPERAAGGKPCIRLYIRYAVGAAAV